MSVSQNFPEVRPTFNLNFARSKTLDPRITFTRASTGTYVGSDGLIKTAAADEARFDHDPETGESLGLLIEEQRTNLFTNSQSFNFNWTNIRSSDSGTTETADPEGFTTGAAFKLVANTDNNTHRLDKANLSMSVSTTYTMSLWAKAAEYTGVSLTIADSSNLFAGIYFDLSNGTFTNGGNAHSGSMIEYPNGWYRCIATYTTPASIAFQQCLIGVLQDGTTRSYIGDNSSGIYIWGAQLEQGSFATSYIETPDALTLTRQIDNAQITGTNFTDFYNQSEGSFNAHFKGGQRYNLNNTTDQWSRVIGYKLNRNSTFLSSHTGGTNRYHTYNGSNQVNQIEGPEHISEFAKASVGYGSDTLSLATKIAVSTGSFLTPNADAIFIGNDGTFQYPLNGHIKQLRYYPERLTNAQLQNLTK